MIRKANNNDKNAIARLIAFAYKDDLSKLEEDLEKVALALVDGIRVDCFFVYEIDGNIVGITAVSDISGRSTCHSLAELTKYLGEEKGVVFYEICKQQLEKVIVENESEGYIEYVGVYEEFRGNGISGKIVAHIIENTSFKNYVLDVKDTNIAAIKTYSKIGFKEFKRIKMQATDFNEDIFMRYHKG